MRYICYTTLYKGVIHLKNNKRFKLPNGFGSIYKLTGNRRNPYVIKKFIDGKQVPIGYKPTYASALSFLCAYNDAPDFYGNHDCNWKQSYFIVKESKTEAGRNRMVTGLVCA